MNYPVAVGDARLAERFGGILGLPVSFVIACDGKIRLRHAGELSAYQVEQAIGPLFNQPECRS